MENDLNSLVETIKQGIASESEQGFVLKTVQTAMSCNLVNGLHSLMSSISEMDGIVRSLNDRIINEMQANIEVLDVGTLFNYLDRLQSKQIKILELYRKVVQGNELFSSDVISEDDKKVIRLMKSFKTPEQKQKFLKLCTDILEENE